LRSFRVVWAASPFAGGRRVGAAPGGARAGSARAAGPVSRRAGFAGASRDQPIAAQPTIKGYNVIAWASDGITYWAVSDLGAGDLNRFAQLFRDAPPDQ